MKMKGNGKVSGKDMKEKVLIFSENEQNKYGLDRKVILKTDIWKKFGKAKNVYRMIYKNNKFHIKIKEYSQKKIKLLISHIDTKKPMSFEGENQRQTTSRAIYNLLKKTAIWNQTINERKNGKDSSDNKPKFKNEAKNENSYKMMRKQSLLDHNEEKIGDALNRYDLRRDVKKMAKFLGFPEIFDEIQKVYFEGRLGRAAGQITFRYGTPKKEKVIALPKFKVNPRIPNNEEGIAEYFNTIKHELAHAITKSGDGERKFENFCRKNDIRLSHDLELSKYHVICKNCGEIAGRYNRKGKVVKSLEKGSNKFTCGECGGNLKLKQLY